MSNDRKVVLVTRRTRLEELVTRHHTLAQARFYLEHLGADVSDYLAEHAAYARALQFVVAALQRWGRYQVVERGYLPNFVFGADDIVVTLGQDGLVANTLKYLDAQPVIGLNPEPARWDGVLLPFAAQDLEAVLADVARDQRACRSVTMAQATLSDGQTMRAVNDLFIGTRSHTSAVYDLAIGGETQAQSSSGVIVSTGLGSTAWIKSVVTGARAIAGGPAHGGPDLALPWDAGELMFVVREPFPSRTTGATQVFGRITPQRPLTLRSKMPEQGVIFSDGIESDFLRFSAGLEALITLAPTAGHLVV